MLPSRTFAHRRPAFTLIELLIVVGIIGLLMAIGLMIGKKVVGGGMERLTQDIIRVLDASVVAYEAATNELPPSRLSVTTDGGKVEYPIVDGRLDNSGYDKVNDPPTSSIARYTAAIASVPQAQAAITGLSAKSAIGKQYVRGINVNKLQLTVNGKKIDVQGQEILDGWGHPIRVVMPGYDGGWGKYYDGAGMKNRDPLIVKYTGESGSVTETYRRSYRPFNPKNAAGEPTGDADEGLCPSRRVYFYSAGPDGDPGRREDNVYSTAPQYPKETAALN